MPMGLLFLNSPNWQANLSLDQNENGIRFRVLTDFFSNSKNGRFLQSPGPPFFYPISLAFDLVFGSPKTRSGTFKKLFFLIFF